MSARQSNGRGGVRKGAGRKPMTGETRRNRVVAFLSDREYRALKDFARKHDLPIGTAAYKLLARTLGRRK